MPKRGLEPLNTSGSSLKVISGPRPRPSNRRPGLTTCGEQSQAWGTWMERPQVCSPASSSAKEMMCG